MTRSYILPAVLGAVLVQAIVSMKQPRATVVALLVAAVVAFVVLVPACRPRHGRPPPSRCSSTAILLAWFLRGTGAAT